jgi:hypothetical protein
VGSRTEPPQTRPEKSRRAARGTTPQAGATKQKKPESIRGKAREKKTPRNERRRRVCAHVPQELSLACQGCTVQQPTRHGGGPGPSETASSTTLTPECGWLDQTSFLLCSSCWGPARCLWGWGRGWRRTEGRKQNTRLSLKAQLIDKHRTHLDRAGLKRVISFARTAQDG